MGLLLDEDYETLKEKGVKFSEDEQKRFLILEEVELPKGLYTVDTCSVLVIIPADYNDGGIDMFWTCPLLLRADGKPIPQTSAPGAGENNKHGDKEFCRWSRHWNKPESKWKRGVDKVNSILRRVHWALKYPDADR